MIVYGDASRPADPRALALAIADGLARLSAAPPGIERHGRLVGLLIAAGELAQGLADHDFSVCGLDRSSPLRDRATRLVLTLARAARRSWDGDFALAEAEAALAARGLLAGALPPDVVIKTPEGFAFYAVYPEAYAQAAAALAGQPARLIGLRSIGLTLGAVVAAALDAADVESLRPVGHPFARRLALAPDIAATFARRDAAFVVVDEGPGLSGSSMAAVAEAIEASGPARIHFFPSHAGEPGAQASEAHRRLWRRLPRHVVSFETAIRDAPGPRGLSAWFEDIVGPPTAPLDDIAGGAWRRWRYGRDESRWPPAAPGQERRKYVLTTRRGRFLLKFVGLGAIGAGKFERARVLAEAGFLNPPLACRHGFLIEPWRDDLCARALDAPTSPALIERVGAYIGVRARAFPAPDWSGASPEALLVMARANVAEALGARAAGALARWTPRLPALAARVARVAIDGRLQPWEWIGDDAGALKTDALDHHAAHDLVGCQDVAWDVAGASAEFDLDATACGRLLAIVEREGARVDRELLAFSEIAYAAFQLGLWSMAVRGDEAAVERRIARLTARLGTMLA